MDAQPQTDLKEYADRLEFICRAQKDEIAKLRTEIERLRTEGGAHAALKSIYLDPDVPQSLRAKAAIGALPHETPKLMSVPPPLDLTAEPAVPLAELVEARRARQNELRPESASPGRGDFKAQNLLPAGRRNDDGDDNS